MQRFLFIGATSFTQAQSKIAHINTNELIEAMPEMKTAKAELEKLGKTYEAEIQKMATEYQNKINNILLKLLPKLMKKMLKEHEEVQTIEQSIRQYQGQRSRRYSEKANRT